MRRRNQRTKAAETLKKSDPQFGFTFPDPSSSRAHSDLKRKKSVTFVDVEHRSPLNDSAEALSSRSLDAKTSEFAFFKKFKSDFGVCSESNDSKSSNEVKQNPKTFVSRVKGQATDSEAKDRCNNYSFSTPIHNTRRGSCGLFKSPVNLTQKDRDKDPRKTSLAFSRDKDTVRSGKNLRSGGISDETGDLFSVKRRKLHQWVKDTWFLEIPELNTNENDLISVLLSRLSPGAEETYPSRFFEEMTDRVKRKTFLDTPGSKFLKRSPESYTEVDHSLEMRKDRSISWQGWMDTSITPRLELTGHGHSSFISRDHEEISFSISCPKGSIYRPPLLKQKASLQFPVEETLDYSHISSFPSRNYKPLSLAYHTEEIGYRSEDLSHHLRQPSSTLFLEWNTETASTKKTDDLHLSSDTKLITYQNAASSSLTDIPWISDYSSYHDLVTRDLCHLPLLSHYTSSSFLLPTTNQTSHLEPEFERHVIDDEDVVSASLNLQRVHHTNSSDFLTRDYTYYHNLSSSPVDHLPFKVPRCEIVSFPFSSISSSNLLEVSSPLPFKSHDPFESHDWIPFKFQSPQPWIDSLKQNPW